MRRQAVVQIVALLRAERSPEEFYQESLEQAGAYKRWSVETLIEAPEKEIWTRWMLPDWPPEQIEPLAEQLTHLWRCTHGRRVVRPDARQVVAELAKPGYRLGVISNTMSARAVPQGLEEYSLASYFQTVILSSTFGRRKPDPAIFLEATRRLDVSPARSAYVGDQISRDVVGPRRAGFAMAILIENRGSPSADRGRAHLRVSKPQFVTRVGGRA